MTELHGKPRDSRIGEYKGRDEYKGQGDTRIVRDLAFSYLAQGTDAGGHSTLQPVDVTRGEELSIEEMGLLALEMGERHHSFFTTAERELLAKGANPDRPAHLQEDSVSEMGEFELADYIKGQNPSGKALTVNETIALAGTDRDLAHRLLQAENIASEGDPRKGVEVGLTAIIEEANKQ